MELVAFNSQGMRSSPLAHFWTLDWLEPGEVWKSQDIQNKIKTLKPGVTKNSFSYPSEILYSKSAKTLFLQGKTRFWKTKFYIFSRLRRADSINHSELWFSNIMHSITILFHWRRSMVISHKTKKLITLLREKNSGSSENAKIMFL